jgi:hypothetical protein
MTTTGTKTPEDYDDPEPDGPEDDADDGDDHPATTKEG